MEAFMNILHMNSCAEVFVFAFLVNHMLIYIIIIFDLEDHLLREHILRLEYSVLAELFHLLELLGSE